MEGHPRQHPAAPMAFICPTSRGTMPSFILRISLFTGLFSSDLSGILQEFSWTHGTQRWPSLPCVSIYSCSFRLVRNCCRPTRLPVKQECPRDHVGFSCHGCETKQLLIMVIWWLSAERGVQVGYVGRVVLLVARHIVLHATPRGTVRCYCRGNPTGALR